MRFIGDADARIREDYLRILRFFRFSARFAAGGLDPEGLSAAIRARDGLARLSRERVRAELMKLLAARRAGEVVQTMGECGFLEPILGGLGYPRRLSRLIAIEAARGRGPDAILRLAALGVAIPEDADGCATGCGSPTPNMTGSEPPPRRSIGLHGIAAPPSLEALRALLFNAGREAARDALALAQAEVRRAPADAAFAAADRFLAEAPEPKLPFSGADLIARGVAGRAAGRRDVARLSGAVGPGRLSQRAGDAGPPAQQAVAELATRSLDAPTRLT